MLTRKETITHLREMIKGSEYFLAQYPVEVETATKMRQDQLALAAAIGYIELLERFDVY
jgi:hypothetical protein